MASVAMGGVKSWLRPIASLPGVAHVLNFARRNTPLLSEGEVAQYHADGYMVLDSLLPEALLDRAVHDLLHHPDVRGQHHHGIRVFDGWKTSSAIRAIAIAPRILRVLRQLYQRKPQPFQTLNFPIGTEQHVHSDAIHFHADPPTYMCGVWLALEDIDTDNGPLLYYPGSHRLPLVTWDDFAPGPGPEHYPRYEAHVRALLERSGLEPRQAILRKGQALIWSANLLHGGSVQRDKGRTRYSQVTHYFFEGCQYYRPMDSYGGYRHLLRPDWVR